MTKKEKFNVDGSALFGDMSKAEIRDAVTRRPGRPTNDNLIKEKGAQNGLPQGMTRQTMIVNIEQMDIIKNYAYTERRKLKDVVFEAFQEYIDNHVNNETLLTRPSDWR